MKLFDNLLALSWQDVFLAACVAYVVTFIIRSIGRARERLDGQEEQEKTYVVQSLNVTEVYERCKELFPIESIEFHGQQFQRGMKIRVTTLQKNIIEGELIGMNHVNLVCIRTANKIIAHQLEKIADVSKAE